MSPEPKGARKSAKGTRAAGKENKGFTEEERAAMRDRVQEMRAGEVDGETAVLDKIAGMPEPDRSFGRRLHALIRETAPALEPRLWYGMPAYSKDGEVLCHFQPASKFKTRYATLGFSDEADLDEGALWPVVFAVKELTPAEEARIVALVKRAVG